MIIKLISKLIPVRKYTFVPFWCDSLQNSLNYSGVYQ